MSNLKVQIWVYLKSNILLKSTLDEVADGVTEEEVRAIYSNVCDPDELCEISGISMTIFDGGGIFENGMEVAIVADAIAACALKFYSRD